MWALHLKNSHAVHGIFGETYPSLNDIELHQLILHSPGELRLSCNVRSMPAAIPDKWRKSNFDKLQVRFRGYGIDNLTIHRNNSTTWLIDIDIKKGWIEAASPDDSFKLSAEFFELQVEFLPYRGSDYEFPPLWFAQVPKRFG